MASKYNWNDFDWNNMADDLEKIVALSRFYGSDPDFLLAGGGNTSIKNEDSLYIKASGVSLADIDRNGFVEMSRDKVRDILKKTYSRDPMEREEQVKNDMLNARRYPESKTRPSVETMFHEQIRYKFIVHTHPSFINGLTCSKDGEAIAKELFASDSLWVDFAPGYLLAKKVQKSLGAYRKEHNDKEPHIILLQNHGVFVSADNPQEIKNITDGIILALETYASSNKYKPVFGKPNPIFSGLVNQYNKAKELSPAIRAILTVNSPDKKCPIVAYDGSDLTMEFVSSENGEKLANLETFTPDHIVYFKRKALWLSQKSQDEDVESIVKKLDSGINLFMKKFGYLPKVILIQGLGMFGIGDSKQSADTALIVYGDALKVMKYSGAFGGPKFLSPNQAKFIDDWEVESYRRKIAATSGAAGRVAGKIAIVTGAAQGFGEGIARHLASHGAYVIIADLNLEGAQGLADSINNQYGASRSIAIKTDVTNEDSVSNMIAEAVRQYGGIDILISNAGVLRAGSVKTLTLKEFEFVTKVNYTGYFICVKHVSPVMALQHRHDPKYMSDIIQINSKSGLQGSNKNSAYAGSKFGGIGLTQSFALELVEDGIKVNSVCPGNFLDGPLWSDPENGLFVQYLRAKKVPGAKTIEDVRRFYESKVPMGRGCTVDDVMHTIYYLIDQPYETGQAVPITGGQVMR